MRPDLFSARTYFVTEPQLPVREALFYDSEAACCSQHRGSVAEFENNSCHLGDKIPQGDSYQQEVVGGDGYSIAITMAAFNRPTEATYEIHENITVDTSGE
jgi:hypothetical protein